MQFRCLKWLIQCLVVMNNFKDSPALPEFHELTDDLSVEAAWAIEISRRVREVEFGEVQLISSEEV
jgi:hypothetical protein